ncbi:MAG: ATP-dependent RNA helicase dhx37, partial [Paramarteilia canceri]
MALHTCPELLKAPIDQIVLELKCLGVHKVENFPFPTRPSVEALKFAENDLYSLNLLTAKTDKSGLEILIPSEIGMKASYLSISPRFSKCILVALQKSVRIAEFIIWLIASLSVRDIFSD